MSTKQTNKWKGTRWWIIGTIFIATTINYIDRQALSVAAPFIKDDLSITNEQYGWIVSAFLFSYAIMQFVSGNIVDKIGIKKGFSIAVVWWSIASMAHALGKGFASFVGLRFLLGIGEAANFPTAMKAISEWFPEKERTKATGILNMGPGLGAIIAPPLMAFLIYQWGWRAAFVITGAIGFLWLFLWQYIYHSPKDHPNLSDEERKLLIIPEEDIDKSQKLAWMDYFKYREVWGIALSRFVSDGAFYFFIFWLPSYLVDVKSFNLFQIGVFSWIPFLAADIGSIAGGWTGSRLMDNGVSLDRSRKIVMWIGAIMVVPILLCIYTDSAFWAIAFISLALFSTQFKQSSLFTLPVDIFDSKNAASVWGISGSAGSFGAMLFTPVIGWLVDNISYSPVIVSVAFLHIISVVIIMIFIPRIQMIKTQTV